jgi:hypothetical protein
LDGTMTRTERQRRILRETLLAATAAGQNDEPILNVRVLRRPQSQNP